MVVKNTRVGPVMLLATSLFAAASSMGCIDTDAAVFVEATVVEANATVAAASLGTNLSGGFRLFLHLGARASGPSEVTIETATLANADQTAEIIAPLPAATDTAFPVTVEPESDVSVVFTFDTADKPLPSDKLGELCGAGGLRIAVVLRDSLQTTSTPAASEVFVPVGCP